MTYKEAYNYFASDQEGNNGAQKYIRCKKVAIKALEKQIPKKPKQEVIEDVDEDTGKHFTWHFNKCPVCNSLIASRINKFCSDCGQAIDWSE